MLQPDYWKRLGPNLLSAEQAAVFIREGALGKEADVGPTGSSRFGGDPDMPEDLDWPDWDGRPLRFMMQVRWRNCPRSRAESCCRSGAFCTFSTPRSAATKSISTIRARTGPFCRERRCMRATPAARRGL